MSVRTTYVTDELLALCDDVVYSRNETVLEAADRVLDHSEIVECYAADVERALHARGEHELARCFLDAVEVALGRK